MELSDQCIEQPTFLCFTMKNGAARGTCLWLLWAVFMLELFAP